MVELLRLTKRFLLTAYFKPRSGNNIFTKCTQFLLFRVEKILLDLINAHLSVLSARLFVCRACLIFHSQTYVFCTLYIKGFDINHAVLSFTKQLHTT